MLTHRPRAVLAASRLRSSDGLGFSSALLRAAPEDPPLIRLVARLAPNLLYARSKAATMTFRLQRISDEGRCTLRLIGTVRPEDLEAIADELRMCGPGVALDLEKVTVIGVEVIRFLGELERQGTTLLSCPNYVREWISREGGQDE